MSSSSAMISGFDTPKASQGFGYAKALIFGEYAVMHGAHALVMALSPKLYATVHPSEVLTQSPPDEFSQQLENLVQIQFGFCPKFTLQSDEFFDSEHQKLGIGSSAAAVVALLQALSDCFHRHFSIQEAIDFHRKLQNGLGSGIDILSSALGGIILAQHCPNHPEILRIPENNLPFITLLATHHQAPTSHFISAAHALDNSRKYLNIIQEMTELCALMAENIKKGDKKSFLEQIEHHTALLYRLGEIIDRPIIPDFFQTLQVLAAEFNVTLKTSGAGGGDIFLAMAIKKSSIDDFLKHIPSDISPLNVKIAPDRY